jgi:cobalt-zinc-cadmium efflux system membrane fusion protein
VKLGLVQGDAVEIVEGVKAGEAVATRGSFLLKTETLKGAIGAGCCAD